MSNPMPQKEKLWKNLPGTGNSAGNICGPFNQKGRMRGADLLFWVGGQHRQQAGIAQTVG